MWIDRLANGDKLACVKAFSTQWSLHNNLQVLKNYELIPGSFLTTPGIKRLPSSACPVSSSGRIPCVFPLIIRRPRGVLQSRINTVQRRRPAALC